MFLMKFSLLAAPEVAKIKTFSAAYEKFRPVKALQDFSVHTEYHCYPSYSTECFPFLESYPLHLMALATTKGSRT